MESASQSDNPPEQPSGSLANLIGFVVAFLTLFLPVFAIAHFSSSRTDLIENSPYPLLRTIE